MMLLLKKIVAPLFSPLPFCIEILLLGLIVLWFTRKQKTGKVVVSLGVTCGVKLRRCLECAPPTVRV
jgi:hypothetical protein